MFAVDCDAAALERAQANAKDLELDDRIYFIQARVGNNVNSRPKEKAVKGGRSRKSSGRGGRGRSQKPIFHNPLPANVEEDESWAFPLLSDCVDTVMTNPPFGTKPDKAGIDIQFLKLGCQLARRSVYSFHKSSTRDYVLKTITALANVEDVSVIAEMKFDLPRSFKFHTAASVDIEVDLIRVQLACDMAIDGDLADNAKECEKSDEDSD